MVGLYLNPGWECRLETDLTKSYLLLGSPATAGHLGIEEGKELQRACSEGAADGSGRAFLFR